MHKSVAEHIDLIPDEHELIFRKPKSLYMRREMRVNYRYSLHGYRISRFIFQLRNSCE